MNQKRYYLFFSLNASLPPCKMGVVTLPTARSCACRGWNEEMLEGLAFKSQWPVSPFLLVDVIITVDRTVFALMNEGKFARPALQGCFSSRCSDLQPGKEKREAFLHLEQGWGACWEACPSLRPLPHTHTKSGVPACAQDILRQLCPPPSFPHSTSQYFTALHQHVLLSIVQKKMNHAMTWGLNST